MQNLRRWQTMQIERLFITTKTLSDTAALVNLRI
jgi:hypothetical protein